VYLRYTFITKTTPPGHLPQFPTCGEDGTGVGEEFLLEELEGGVGRLARDGGEDGMREGECRSSRGAHDTAVWLCGDTEERQLSTTEEEL
jgi:hypothetical protein